MRERWVFLAVLALLVGGVPAAHGQTFTKFSVGPAAAEATSNFESAADDLDLLRDEVELLSQEVSAALLALTERLDRVEAAGPG